MRRVGRVSLASARAGLLFALLLAGPRAADAWPPVPGNPGQEPEPEPFVRKGDRVEEDFRRGRDDRRIPPEIALPGLPGPPLLRPPFRETRPGSVTMSDLHLTPDGGGGYRGTRPGYRFTIDVGGGIHFIDRPPVELSPASMLGLLGMMASFDLTDIVMRLHGDDPYGYDKARVVELTRPLRTAMTDAERVHRLQRAATDLPHQLAEVWARADLPPAARRALLFSLWDESLEETQSAAGQTATAARATILDFVCHHLPAGTPDAYSATELTELNAHRRSIQAFAPYERSAP